MKGYGDLKLSGTPDWHWSMERYEILYLVLKHDTHRFK